ncbi:cytochrome b5-like [Venturia canescens]|uniref:cytochrome b5-like n=1 Tax=Venturia canescens TaxID=32260 RepID=UPI001C9BBEAA|nr:cytochrome b5-like [Venturia canescens]
MELSSGKDIFLPPEPVFVLCPTKHSLAVSETPSMSREQRGSWTAEISQNSMDLMKARNSGSLDIISLDELAWHDSIDDCWIAVYDYVYDCTEFLDNHPGGFDVILEYAGRDATLAFIGTDHSNDAKKLLQKYLIGELPMDERLFRKNDGIKIVEL